MKRSRQLEKGFSSLGFCIFKINNSFIFFEIVIAMRGDLHTKLECYCYFTYVVLYCAFKYFSTWRWNLGTYFFVSHRKWDVSFSSWYDDKGFENKVCSYVKCKKDRLNRCSVYWNTDLLRRKKTKIQIPFETFLIQNSPCTLQCNSIA